MKKRWKAAGGAVLAAAVLAGGVWLGGMAWHDHALREGFVCTDPANPYQSGVPIEQMDFSVYAPYLDEPVVPVGYSTVFSLPFDLTYYTEENGVKTPACTLEKGSQVCWGGPSGGLRPGYGLQTYPTYEKGWRWGRPFTAEEELEERAGEALPWYYVKTEDLNRIAAALADGGSPHLTELAQKHSVSAGEAAFSLVHSVDTIFYDNGVYLSPDLLEFPLA